MGQQLHDQRCGYGRMSGTGWIRSVFAQVFALASSVAGVITDELERARLKARKQVDSRTGRMHLDRRDGDEPEQLLPVIDTKQSDKNEKS